MSAAPHDPPPHDPPPPDLPPPDLPPTEPPPQTSLALTTAWPDPEPALERLRAALPARLLDIILNGAPVFQTDRSTGAKTVVGYEPAAAAYYSVALRVLLEADRAAAARDAQRRTPPPDSEAFEASTEETLRDVRLPDMDPDADDFLDAFAEAFSPELSPASSQEFPQEIPQEFPQKTGEACGEAARGDRP